MMALEASKEGMGRKERVLGQRLDENLPYRAGLLMMFFWNVLAKAVDVSGSAGECERCMTNVTMDGFEMVLVVCARRPMEVMRLARFDLPVRLVGMEALEPLSTREMKSGGGVGFREGRDEAAETAETAMMAGTTRFMRDEFFGRCKAKIHPNCKPLVNTRHWVRDTKR